ncbi:MAG TPA: nuclear transport factor 2 family protein [Puia sp.]|nr:nuclear transport factor 2 family protein [Puia sp.]
MKDLFGKTLLVLIITIFSRQGFSQGPSGSATGPQHMSAGKLVRAYYAAYEKKDWNSLELVLADGFTFSSPVDDHISVKSYKERCWPNCYKIKRFDMEKLVVNGDEAFVTYNGWTTDGKLFRNTEYFRFKDGKILSDECFFGKGISYPNSGK